MDLRASRFGISRLLDNHQTGMSPLPQRWVASWLAITILIRAESPLSFHQLPDRSPIPTNSPLFVVVPPEKSGVDVILKYPVAAPFALLQEQGGGAGVAIGDYDGDGLPDLFFSNHNHGCRLYRNLGGWKFADVTEAAGVRAAGRWAAGVSFVDFDGDGDLDLFVAAFGSPNLLFVNRGDGTFEDQAPNFGLAWSGSSVAGAFADYDRDGRLDLYLLTHRDSFSPNQKLPANTADGFRRGTLVRDAAGQTVISKRDRGLFELIPKTKGRAELIIAGESDRLFHQKRDGTFEDVTESSGIRGFDIGLAAAWWDYDGDGWPDIYVSNDHKSPDRLWKNQRDGTFREVTREALPHVPFASMGSDVADVDNDGYLDLLATDMAASTRFRRMMISDDLDDNLWFYEGFEPKQYPRNALYLGTGTPRVFEIAFLAGLAETDWTWTPRWGDFDNDGWVDLFVANGMSRDFLGGDYIAQLKQNKSLSWRALPPLREANLAFRNRGDRTFAPCASDWGLDRVSTSYGAATGDFDRDGDLDLVVVNLDEAPSIYENVESRHHRFVVRLRGRRSHPSGVGAIVSLRTRRGIQTGTITPGTGFMSSNEPLLHFGLGEDDRVPLLTVLWPSGHRQSFAHLLADRIYTVEEPSGPRPIPVASGAEATPLFESKTLTGFAHQHTPLDEFAREPSLPWQLSRSGPPLALADLDGDSIDDFYLGGSTLRAGVIGMNRSNGPVKIASIPRSAPSLPTEDAGAVFLDVNLDGLLDLYITSARAGVESNSKAPRDRLFFSSADGTWQESPAGFVPEGESSGVVVALDFDHDDDLDLFVGGRSISGRYPLPTRSRLLRNENGRLVDVTSQLAPDFNTIGIVTDAVASDADGDGWLDLVLTEEWGPMRLFRNHSGRFKDFSTEAGLTTRRGLWQAVAAGDVDGDSDLDYVAVNFGGNSRYQLADRGAIQLTRGDFWNTGQEHLLESFFENGRCYPFRRRSSLLREAPFLLDRFPTYESMAEADLKSLLGREETPLVFTATIRTVESGIWLNDGSAKFTFHPLPVLAQAAPGFGVALSDFDGDLFEDILISQNFRGANIETGPLDGGLGLLLRGTASGIPEPVTPLDSGVILPAESRRVALTDVDGDGYTDALITTHDGPLMVLRNNRSSRRPPVVPFTVRLRGHLWNPTAVGSRIEVRFRGGQRRTVEVHSRSGGSARNGASLTFPHPPSNPPIKLTVRWPNGKVETVFPSAGNRVLDLMQDSAGKDQNKPSTTRANRSL